MNRRIVRFGLLVLATALPVGLTIAYAFDPQPPVADLRLAQADTEAAPAGKAEAPPKRTKRVKKKVMEDQPAPKAEATPALAPAGAAAPASAVPAAPTSAVPVGATQAGAVPANAQPSVLAPVAHAAGGKIGTCMPLIQSAAASLIDSAHDAVSAFSSAQPDANLFQSMIALKYSNPQAPNAAALIVAAPVAGDKCEGSLVRIYPTTRTCGDVQGELMKTGKLLTTLETTPVIETPNQVRHMLLTTGSGSCVVVAVGLR